MSNETQIETITQPSRNGHRRGLLYARVSTDTQAEKGYSLPSQLEACRQYAEGHGFLPVSELADDCSGTIPINDRPQGAELYRLVDAGKVDAVILFTNDRTARDDKVLEYLIFKSYLHDHKVELHYSDSGLDPYTMEGNLVGYIKSMGAAEERKKILERTRRGKLAKAKSGKVVGNGLAPYGYKKVGDSLVIVPDEEAIVVKIFQWYTIEGLSGHQIARRLSEMRVPTSGESRGLHRKRASGIWGKSAVYQLLDNRTYIGEWGYNKLAYDKTGNRKPNDAVNVVTVKVPQIIDTQTFDQAQAKRKSNKKTSRRKNQYLMSGRLLCGCGKHIVGCQSGGSPMYGCYQKFHRYRDIEEDVCQERYAKAWLVDAIAWDFALHSKKSGAEFRAMLEKRQEEQKRGTTKIQERLAYVERQIEEKSKKIRRIASLLSDTEDQDAIAAFKSDMRLASQVKADFEQEQEELLEKIAAMQPITDDEIVDVLIIREQEIKKLQDATFEERRRYVERIDLMGTITGGVLHLSCKLPIPGKSYDLSSPELQLTYNQVENSDVAVGGNGISGLL